MQTGSENKKDNREFIESFQRLKALYNLIKEKCAIVYFTYSQKKTMAYNTLIKICIHSITNHIYAHTIEHVCTHTNTHPYTMATTL